VLLLALAVTGVLGRAFHGVRTATDTVSTDAGFSIRAIHITGESYRGVKARKLASKKKDS